VFKLGKNTVKVTAESETGRNTRFRDTTKGTDMTLNQFVKKIEKGDYADYHVRVINGVKTPASNPDNSSKNNLD
jgi:hypothetical protein